MSIQEDGKNRASCLAAGYTETLPTEQGRYSFVVYPKSPTVVPEEYSIGGKMTPYAYCICVEGHVNEGKDVMEFTTFDTRVPQSFSLTADGVAAMKKIWNTDAIYFKALDDLPFEPEHFLPPTVSRGRSPS